MAVLARQGLGAWCTRILVHETCHAAKAATFLGLYRQKGKCKPPRQQAHWLRVLTELLQATDVLPSAGLVRLWLQSTISMQV
jgi:hypothetical protein